MCRSILDHYIAVGREILSVNGFCDDVLAHICLPTIPAKLSGPGVRRFTLFHLSRGERAREES